MSDTPSTATCPSWRRGLLRGESAIASAGIALAAMLLALSAAGAWWMGDAQHRILHQARLAQLQATGAVLGQTAELMLAAGEVSVLRRIVLEARREHDLLDCRLVLPDGRVIASAEPARITLVSLPDRWSGTPIDERTEAPLPGAAGTITLSVPLVVPGRGAARLEMTAPPTQRSFVLGQAQMGVGLIGAAGLLALLLIYRRARSRILPLGLIGEALLGAQREPIDPDALSIAGHQGPQVAAWNRLVASLDQWRQAAQGVQVRAALAQRRDSAGDLEQVCDALPMGLLLVDPSGQVRYANGAAVVLLGVGREQVIDQSATKLLAEPAVCEALQAALSGASRARRVIEWQRDDEHGGGLLRLGIRPLQRQGAGQVLVSIEDITQNRVAQDSRSAFVSHAAHELRTPLTNIRLYLETALEEGQNDPQLRGKCLNVISQEARRLELMVSGILSAAEVEAGALKIVKGDVRLDNLLAELEADYQAQARDKKVSLRFELPPKLPMVQADREKFALALHNLMGNALKYTPEGGSVRLTVEVAAGQVRLSVIDTGIGIGPQDAARVFERFYRAQDPRVASIKGSGLGLALAREVARQHGGDISVQSQLDAGSTFTLTLPLADGQVQNHG